MTEITTNMYVFCENSWLRTAKICCERDM